MRYSVQLRSTDFGYLFEIENVDEMCNESFKFLHSVLDETCPIRKTKMSKDQPTYMTALKALCKKNQRLQREERLYSVETVELQNKHVIMN